MAIGNCLDVVSEILRCAQNDRLEGPEGEMGIWSRKLASADAEPIEKAVFSDIN